MEFQNPADTRPIAFWPTATVPQVAHLFLIVSDTAAAFPAPLCVVGARSATPSAPESRAFLASEDSAEPQSDGPVIERRRG